MASFFLEHEASTNIRDDFGSTFLHTAVLQGDGDVLTYGLSELISAMVKNGRSLKELDSDNRTPMQLAIFLRKHKAAEALEKASCTV